MEEEIIRIAKENISNRNKGGAVMFVSIVLFFVSFVYSVETNFEYIPSILAFVLVPTIGFYIAHRFYSRVIGKKTALDYEVERLKALHPEEKLQLPEIDDAELKLREMVRKSNRDDMI